MLWLVIVVIIFSPFLTLLFLRSLHDVVAPCSRLLLILFLLATTSPLVLAWHCCSSFLLVQCCCYFTPCSILMLLCPCLTLLFLIFLSTLRFLCSLSDTIVPLFFGCPRHDLLPLTYLSATPWCCYFSTPCPLFDVTTYVLHVSN